MSEPVKLTGRITPYERGFAAAQRGESGPAIPKGDASWAERLYNRGWMDGRQALSLNQGGEK